MRPSLTSSPSTMARRRGPELWITRPHISALRGPSRTSPQWPSIALNLPLTAREGEKKGVGQVRRAESPLLHVCVTYQGCGQCAERRVDCRIDRHLGIVIGRFPANLV